MTRTTKSHHALAPVMGLLALGLVAAASPALAGVRVGVFVPVAPPVPRFEAVPPPPGAYGPGRVVWQPGHWEWDGHDYDWVPGHYQQIPRHRHHWTEGHWAHRHRGWVWVDGHWR